jgi:hypothetical protein
MASKPSPSTERTTQSGSQILQRAEIARRVDALFRAMAHDYLLREQFITNPAQATAEYVYSKTLPPAKATAINQLFYSVISNHKLLGWLRKYSNQYRGKQPSASQFLTDFGRAAVEYSADHVVFSLIRSALIPGAELGFDNSLLNVLFSRGPGIREDGPDGGPDSGTPAPPPPPPPPPPKTGGTEGGPSTNQPRHSLFLSQGYVLVTLEPAIQYATQLRDVGALDIAASEISAT